MIDSFSAGAGTICGLDFVTLTFVELILAEEGVKCGIIRLVKY